MSTADEDEDEDERTFDPRHPRSNYSLFPPEHLLYCEECHDIKCPRCITEEIVCWYCPSCLFETPSSMVRSEVNRYAFRLYYALSISILTARRCARNCFNCPICTANLVVTSIGDGTVNTGPWILNCNYCMWTSLDIGIKFDKPTNIRSQLDKVANGGVPKSDSKSSLSREPVVPRELSDESISEPPAAATETTDSTARFASLKAFYKQQLASSIGTDATSSYGDFASPSALTRIMSLYTTSGSSGLRKPKTKTPLMREALTTSEGLQIGHVPSNISPNLPISPPVSSELYDIPTPTQLLSQYPLTAGGNPHARHTSQLRPIPTLLRTKRSKRCKDCKHILVKPEFKPQSTRFRIRLVALAYVPLVSLRPLHPPPAGSDGLLRPGKPAQFILTLKNHLFDPVKVSLGVPGTVPGKYAHKVTVLCPQFEIGANTDVWDDALGPGSEGGGTAAKGTGTMEAGKVYERGRNWVGVGVEVVCSPIMNTSANGGESGEQEDMDEDADVLEIPIRVRLEWRQSDAAAEEEEAEGKGAGGRFRGAAGKKDLGTGIGGGDEDPAKRELAYWMVVGVGKVGRI